MREGNLTRNVYWQANIAVSLSWELSGVCSCFACHDEALMSPVLIPLAAGQRNKLLHVSLHVSLHLCPWEAADTFL